MFRKAFPTRLIAAGVFALAVACFGPSVSSAPEPAVAPPDPHVLAFAFGAIQDRYLTEVPMTDIALEGLRGLSVIDPAVMVDKDRERHILVRYDDRLLSAYPIPAGDDPDAWATFVLAVEKDLGTLSPPLRRVGAEKLYEAILDAALSKLDMFSRYAGAEEARSLRASRNGFGGIGVRYEPATDGLALIEVVPDGPAGRAGILVGDHIVAVDGTPTASLGPRDVARLLRGSMGAAVKVTIRRAGNETFSAILRRSLIIPTTVTSSLRDGIAVIAISSFNQGTAKSVETALQGAKASPGLKGVILDLRGNPGGLLDQSVAVARLFMDRGRIVSTKGRNPASKQAFNAQSGGIGDDVRLVVLVDGKSASAAEIVASALQDSGRAVLVGTNTYGKGTVQTIVQLPNDGEMTLTWSRYYSPSGYALHGLGVLPTICTADNAADPATLLGELENSRSRITTSLAAWRAVGVDEADLRRELRTRCPAAPRNDAASDMETARRLLLTPALLHKALALSAAPSAASSLASFALPHGEDEPPIGH